MLKENKTVECERCGCRDTREIDKYMGQTTNQCNHCGHKTIAGFDPYEEIATEFVRMACPVCESTNNKTTRGPQTISDGRIKRFHKCGDCHNSFASYEVPKQ